MSNNGYITGSRAYGIPSDESDIDLVVCLPREETLVADNGDCYAHYENLENVKTCINVK